MNCLSMDYSTFTHKTFYQKFMRWNGTETLLAKCFRVLVFGQFISGFALLIFGLIDSVRQPEDNQSERVVATCLFSALTLAGAGSGLVSLYASQTSSYRLLQLFHLSLNLLLLPGCGFYMTLFYRQVQDTDIKLNQLSWTNEEKQEEVNIQHIRYIVIVVYGLLLSLQMASGFLNCVILWKFPESVRHVKPKQTAFDGKARAQDTLYATI